MVQSILIIEDDADYRELVERVLEHEGFTVQSRSSLKAALEVLNVSKPDAVVLDLGLPDSNMDETVDRVKQASNSAIIVVLSGHPSKAEECIRKSASGFVNKNDGLQYLGREIRNAIHSFSKIQRIDSALNTLTEGRA